LSEVEAAQVVYLVRLWRGEALEAGVDDTEDYPYGYSHISERFPGLKLGRRTCRISKELSGRIILPAKFRMVAGWCNRSVMVPMTFEGYCDTSLFEAWVEQQLVPELKLGQVVVMDNASFHKSQRTQDLIEQAGCTLLFLPPYSPDLNKIEKFWARLKTYLRKTLDTFDGLWDAVDHALRQLS